MPDWRPGQDTALRKLHTTNQPDWLSRRQQSRKIAPQSATTWGIVVQSYVTTRTPKGILKARFPWILNCRQPITIGPTSVGRTHPDKGFPFPYLHCKTIRRQEPL